MKKNKYTLKRVGKYTVDYYEGKIRRFRHYGDSEGVEWWKEYDENGNEIHCKDSKGYERWSEYDENGNKIHYKDSTGHEWWSEYDENGNEIHYKDSNDFEWWREYDENGNKIHYKDSNGDEWWSEDHPDNPQNKKPEYQEPFTFGKGNNEETK